MPLKISLKPGEKLFIAGAVIQNGDHSAELSVLNDVPVLREKDILTEQTANTLAKRLYLCVQLMYMDAAHLSEYQRKYALLVTEVLKQWPESADVMAKINAELACGRFYPALRLARQLLQIEQEHQGDEPSCA
ncbi:MAG: flagellar biosynthesis repressor FlbT [Thiobacillaceae bacterium]|nr:flagellar biosynthesis repressor FlbT [Thiobacillaceae bacterium]MDW8324173.1 flagellar biosynthesis repressor FlbT [Burkholderiales bacterium]